VATVGITAGASAPDELIESVIAAIAAIRPVSVKQLDGVTEDVEFTLPPQLRNLTRAAAE
jgi:4-hydroxy-3-methylbut-2-enyl diphosphate reductase